MKEKVLKMALAVIAFLLLFFAFACKSYTGFSSRTIAQRSVIHRYGNIIAMLSGTLLAFYNFIVVKAIKPHRFKDDNLKSIVSAVMGTIAVITLYFTTAAMGDAGQTVYLKLLGFLKVPVGVMGEDEALFIVSILPISAIIFVIGLAFPYLMNRIFYREKGFN